MEETPTPEPLGRSANARWRQKLGEGDFNRSLQTQSTNKSWPVSPQIRMNSSRYEPPVTRTKIPTHISGSTGKTAPPSSVQCQEHSQHNDTEEKRKTERRGREEHKEKTPKPNSSPTESIDGGG
ncbi:Uncharacterized protein Rs2_30882 [Raphanus sativus]|nr:Uncharacterized protein Rs2_30882 [Raphanus sativus]